MSDHGTSHTEFDELAAGYVLDSLEPADEQRFLSHAADCPDCRATIARFREVAAALAEAAPAAEPSPDLGDRIMAATRPNRGRGGGSVTATTDDPRSAGGGAPGTDTDATIPGTQGPGRHRSRPGRHSARPGDTGPAGSGHARPGETGPTDAEPDLPPGVTPLRQRPRWQWAAAAAAVLIAIGGIWGGLAATSGTPASPLAACSQPGACPEVTLHGVKAPAPATAKVVVLHNEAWMEPTDMTANGADQIYVLWQIIGKQAPKAIGGFDVRSGVHAPIKVGGLAGPPAGTVFAVSIEPGHTVPASPTKVLSEGKVS